MTDRVNALRYFDSYSSMLTTLVYNRNKRLEEEPKVKEIRKMTLDLGNENRELKKNLTKISNENEALKNHEKDITDKLVFI